MLEADGHAQNSVRLGDCLVVVGVPHVHVDQLQLGNGSLPFGQPGEDVLAPAGLLVAPVKLDMVQPEKAVELGRKLKAVFFRSWPKTCRETDVFSSFFRKIW